MESIAREAARLEELVDELLAASRAEVDAREQEQLDTGALLRSLKERVRPAAATRGMDVRVETVGDPVAHGNRATLERALLAVVHNAITYGRNDGTVTLSAARDRDAVRIEVADDGPGFTPEGLAHATERFWRGDASHPRGGTGLGSLDRASYRGSQSRQNAFGERRCGRGGRNDRPGGIGSGIAARLTASYAIAHVDYSGAETARLKEFEIPS